MKKQIICFISVLVIAMSFSLPVFASTSSEPETGENDGGLVSGILNGIKDFFIPDENFFAEFNQKINTVIEEKTGGLSRVFTEIKNRFSSIGRGRSTLGSSLEIKIPKNHIYDGSSEISVDILASDKGFLKFLRGFNTAFIIVITIIICYKKLVKLFDK